MGNVIVCLVILFLVIKACSSGEEQKSSAPPQATKTTVDLDTGIKPHSVCNILSSKGIETTDWKPIFEEEWHCISTYIDIGQGKRGGMPNNIAYYVNGSQNHVTKILLVLNINNPRQESSAIQKLLKTSIVLTETITQLPLSPTLQNAITNGEAATEDLPKFTLEVTRDNWPTDGYEIHFSIIPKTKAEIKKQEAKTPKEIRDLLALANTGDRTAQNKLGNAYYNGEGTPKDFEAAFNLYLSAAKQGLPNAQYNLGAMYFEGEGTTKNNEKAVEWLQKAKAQGITESQYYLDKIKANK